MTAKIAGIILAAGSSTRMGEANKLTTLWQDKPLLRHVADAALASNLSDVVVVTGHQAGDVMAVLPPDMRSVHNPQFAEGMAGSLHAGMNAAAAQPEIDGVLILLGDMPLVTSEHINWLVGQFSPSGLGSIVMATAKDKPGNPVLFARMHFEALLQTSGDRGARDVVQANKALVETVEIGKAAVRDFDDAAAFEN